MPDRTIRVLLVDSDVRMLSSLASMVDTDPALVADLASDGETALQKITDGQNAYDAVLMHKTLDDIDGIALLRHITEIRPAVRVVIFTGADEDYGIEALRAGAYRYILSPPNPDEVVMLLHQIGALRETEVRLVKEGELLEATCRIAQMIVSQSREDLLGEIAETGRRLLNGTACVIWELDDSHQVYRPTWWTGHVDLSYLHQAHMDRYSAESGRLLCTRAPVNLPRPSGWMMCDQEAYGEGLGCGAVLRRCFLGRARR